MSDGDALERLVRLRGVLQALATDLAAARRRAAALELEKRRLERRVSELESRLAERSTLSLS